MGKAGARRLFIIFILVSVIIGGGFLIKRTGEGSSPSFTGGGFSESQSTAENYIMLVKDENDIYSGDLVLVNQKYVFRDEKVRLAGIYENKNKSYQVKDTVMKLQPHVIEAFNSMMADFDRRSKKNDVIVISAQRSVENQREILEEKIKELGEEEAVMWVARPGHSEHHTGLSLDLSLYFKDGTSASFDGTGDYLWITENCWKYGFIIRYTEEKTDTTMIQSEPWHLRYVGLPHAYIMREKNLCLEEYIDFIRAYSFEGQRVRVSAEGKEYEIYYAEGDGIKILPGANYKISGNNVDGFIISLLLS